MIIVLEGSDGTGKTTLARELEKRGFRYVHNGVPGPGEDVFATYTRQLLACGRENVVFDRLHVGEIVYGGIIRGKSRLTLGQLRLLNRLIFGLGGLIILCEPPLDFARATWRGRHPQEYVKQELEFIDIYNLYRDLWNNEFVSHRHRLTYDLTLWLGKASAFTDKALSLLVRACPAGVIGSPYARYLLVGERSNGPYDLGFYADNGSSAFLNAALLQAGYLEGDVAFTNALDAAGQRRDLRRLYELQRGRAVIALGRTAQRVCLAQGVPHLPAEHPQFVKRFHLKDKDKYIAKLRRFREGK